MSVQKLFSACCPFLLASPIEDEDVYCSKETSLNIEGFAQLEYEAELAGMQNNGHMTQRQPKSTRSDKIKSARSDNIIILDHVAAADGKEEVVTYDLASYRMNDAEGAALVDEILQIIL